MNVLNVTRTATTIVATSPQLLKISGMLTATTSKIITIFLSWICRCPYRQQDKGGFRVGLYTAYVSTIS